MHMHQCYVYYVISYLYAIYTDLADFDNTSVTVTFLPDAYEDVIDSPINEHTVLIVIVDDDINEAAEQIFILTLQHVKSIKEDSISFGRRNISLCTIIDDDGE